MCNHLAFVLIAYSETIKLTALFVKKIKNKSYVRVLLFKGNTRILTLYRLYCQQLEREGDLLTAFQEFCYEND